MKQQNTINAVFSAMDSELMDVYTNVLPFTLSFLAQGDAEGHNGSILI